MTLPAVDAIFLAIADVAPDDLKPANVLVAEGGQPKVLDFGIARATGADMQRLTVQTAHGQLMGTLAYMSPEQLGGRSHDIDARSDVYALGVLLYRLLAERLPFDVGDVPWLEAVQRLLAAEPPPIGAVNASLGGPLEDIVARAMARAAGDRYQSAADLAADLQRFLAGRQTIAAHAARRAVPSFQKDEPAPALVAADADAIYVATDARGLTATSATTGQGVWTVNIGSVRALAASASSRLVAAGLAFGSIELLDSRTGAPRASLDAHLGPVAAIAFSADGRHLTSVGCDGAVRLWDAATAQLVTTLLQHDGGGASLTLLADGRVAVAWADGRLAILAVPCEL